jgi:hypothetical protein
MEWGWGRRAMRATGSCLFCPGLKLAVVGAFALAGCTVDGQPNLSAAQPRGATVAFESIDGPPAAQFSALVQRLNDEAQTRRLAVISRENSATYRVRGYLAAKVVKGQTIIAWVWDVFDDDERRALRITGEETANSHPRDAWAVADDAMLRRIAHSSMEQLAAFLTSADISPGTPVAGAEPKIVLVGDRDPSPEAAVIYRIFRPQTDPVPAETAEAPADNGAVPLPRRRPAPQPVITSRRDGLILVAVSQ